MQNFIHCLTNHCHQQESKIDKHTYMKFNAYKNTGELYERMGIFKEAKESYTKALRIKEREPFIWTRMGFIEYEHCKDLKLAKKCFEAAAQTLTTIERRSAKINPIFVKLAEISFQSFDFKKAEDFVDAILERSNDRDPQPVLFAHILKAFLASLQNQEYQVEEHLRNARVIKPASSYMDLDIIKNLYKQISVNLQTKDYVISQATSKGPVYKYLRMNTRQREILIRPSQDFTSFMLFFDDFLQSAINECEKVSPKELQKSFLNCEEFFKHLQARWGDIAQSEKNWEYKLNQYEQGLKRKEKILTSDNDHQTSQPTGALPNSQLGSKRAINQDASKRHLRKKFDQSEKQMLQYNLNPIKSFKDFLLEPFEASNQAVLPFVFSHQEIINAKNYFQLSHANLKQLDGVPQGTQMHGGGDQDMQQVFQLSHKITYQEAAHFQTCLQTVNNKGVTFILRNMLKFLLDTDSPLLSVINYNNACSLYRWFLLLINNDFQFSNLDQVGSFAVLLTNFEMSLFNKLVIKHVKSNALMTQRQKLFDYFEYQLPIIEHQLESMEDKDVAEVLKIRFYYALMFYSFEIKNDMASSIQYYQRLNVDYLKNKGPIRLNWVSYNFILDEDKVTKYGSCKIREAQVVRDYDEKLMHLKLSEIREMEEAKRLNGTANRVSHKDRPEFKRMACFYLDQLCQYLQRTYQSDSSFTANFSTNEDKIKEMWSKLSYSLCRCESSTLFKISTHLFSILTAFQYLHKQFYEQFVLKKLEFEPLLTEIQDRLKLIFDQVQQIQKQNENILITDLGTPIKELLSSQLQMSPSNVSTFLTKLEVDLLRLFNNEFLYFNVILNQSKQPEQTQSLLQSYFQSLFFIEMLQACICSRYDQDISTNLKSVITLIRHLDKLTHKNNEVFSRAYLKLLTVVFPTLIGLFASDQRTNQQRKDITFSHENDLLALLMTLLYYFFDLKYDLDEIQQENRNKSSHSSVLSEDDEDEKENLTLKFLEHVKNKQTKPLKTQGFAQINQLTFLQSQGVIDLSFLDDVVTVCNALSGDRLNQCGQMTDQDISHVATLLDTIAKYLLENVKQFKEKCPTLKEQVLSLKTAIETNIRAKIEVKSFQKSKQCPCPSQNCFNDDWKLVDSLQKVTFFVLNVFSHFGVTSAPFQVVTFTNRERQSLLEAVPSLMSSKQLSKNLRHLAYLDMQYSGGSAETAHLLSLCDSDFFNISNECKQFFNYKLHDNYPNSKRYYSHSLNANIMAVINFCNQQESQARASLDSRWSNLGRLGKVKLCTMQILNLLVTKRDSQELVLSALIKLGIITDQELIRKKHSKLRLLDEQTQLCASLCEKLERLLMLSEDPRRGGNQAQIEQAVTNAFNSEQLDTADLLQILTAWHSNVTQICQVYPQTESFQFNISFDYKYIQAVNAKRDYQKDQEKVSKFQYLGLLKQALEIASTNRSFSGTLHCYIKTLRGCLKLAMTLKYHEETLDKKEFKQLKQAIKSPFLSLSRDILESASKTLLGEKTIFKYLEDQIQASIKGSTQVSNQKGGEGATGGAGHATEEVKEGTTSILLDDKTAASIVRPNIFRSSAMPEYNQFESILFQLYKTGDELFALMKDSANPWIRSNLQHILTKSLYEELLVKNPQKASIAKNQFGLLAEMMKPVISSIHSQEELSSPVNPYSNKESKNLITSLSHSETQLAKTRIKIKQFFIQLNEECLDYEPIKEIFKRYTHTFKSLENKSKDSPQQKPFEVLVMFKISKDKYISSICSHIDRQLQLYLNLRKTIINKGQGQNKWKTGEMSFEAAKTGYKQFREAIQVTKDQLPHVLKDIFEIFVDSHQKKSFLNSRKQIDDYQKRLIRLALLKCCAYCGPDSELEQSKITSKFLDLSKISLDDYAFEGLLISIKWYLSVLETRQNKKEGEFHKKLKATLEEIEKVIKEQQQQQMAQDETSATKVFQDSTQQQQQ